MGGRGSGGGKPRRGSGRASTDRAHSRPPGAPSPAAESAARVAALLEGILAVKGVALADVAQALGVRPIDVSRWRRGQPIPKYRRAELEPRIASLEVVTGAETGKPEVRLVFGRRGPSE